MVAKSGKTKTPLKYRNKKGTNLKESILDGLPVIPATKNLRLTITGQDIKGSRSKAPDKCAAAIALCREMKVPEARVHLGRTYIRQGNRWVKYATTPSLRQEIISFDRGGTFEPGEYMLYKIPEAHRSGKSTPDNGYRKNRKKDPDRKPYANVQNVRGSAVHI